MISLLGDLVRVPSRAGVDSYEDIFGCIAGWLKRHDLPCTRLCEVDGRIIALSGDLGASAEQRMIVLNAPVDTAGFGDLAAWTKHPTSAEIADGYLYGRGSADSKAGISVFCHLLARFRSHAFAKAIGFVFDGDEHTGQFKGIRTYLDQSRNRIGCVLIGYPGHEHVGIGARGFWRGTLHVSGAAAHSGSSHDRGVNAISKAARLVRLVEDLQETPPPDAARDFPLPPKFTVTAISGGGEFSAVPDSCVIELDVRLTPAYPAEGAVARVQALLEQIDQQFPSPRPSRILKQQSIPAYRLSATRWPAAALARAGHLVLRRSLALKIMGPSNIGNVLAESGIPATCGFGVAYRNIHAANECIEIDSLLPTLRVYEAAVQELLNNTTS
jgi:succinyl-diaminopimelate desuccinylase